MVRRVLIGAALAVAAAAGPAHAAGTAGREGSTLVFRGGTGADGVFVKYVEPPLDGAVVASYVFQGSTGSPDTDGTVTAGPGCEQQAATGVVLCAAAGVEHIDVDMGAGDDGVSAGSGTAMPASISVHGGPGDDSVIGDEKAPSGEEKLYGDEGDDAITAFSRDVAAAMEGGPGNDRFTWEQTNRGVPTSADGGPGDDVFDTREALGSDTITGGGGADAISVRDRGRGDPDTVSCGSEGLAGLKSDRNDHIAAGCRLDALARSVGRFKAHLMRLHRADLARARALRFAELRVPGPGVVTGLLQVIGRAGLIRLRAHAAPRGAGPVSLRFRVSARARSSARSPVVLVVVLDFAPTGGRPRRYVIQRRLR